MQTANTVLSIYQERGYRGLPLERVYRHLFDPDFFLRAYGKIYRNAGAMTKGSTRETVDGMDLQKIHDIINLLRQERYRWTPVRRTEIPKANGKTRPLGIPTWSDKLVQEVLRTLLEPYYERKFSDHSHGFRPDRGCHTALREIQKHWKGTIWFIEGDIKGCFDNIDHEILLKIIQRDIHDGRLLALIDGLLKAGYMQDWKYYDTTSGTPQGGIISPFLSNIYLNELDWFVENLLIPTYTKGERRKNNPAHQKLGWEMYKARKQGDSQRIIALRRELRKLPAGAPCDPNYRRLRYVRYADDFLLGFAGPKQEAEEIRDRLGEYLKDNLKLTLSIEKTLITHAVNEKAKYLGYEITVTRANEFITAGGRRNNGNIALLMPRKVLKKYLERFSSSGKIIHRAELEPDDNLTIINRYQSILRGLYNYYCMASNISRRMVPIRYILETSLTKTLAHKHQTNVRNIYRKYKWYDPESGLTMLRAVKERKGKEPLVAEFGGISFVRQTGGLWENIDFRHDIAWFTPGGTRSEVVQRLLYDKCELCGDKDASIQMHHVRKLADLDKPGRTPKANWERIMSARKRKSLAVCKKCHASIHAGRYDGPRL